tara:strand:- start:5969 stop:6601 length:633 start_codon:yes stop_codon:yes gene_type:complete
MANFTFSWSDNSQTSIPLPADDFWTCDNISPSAEFLSVGGDLVMYATQTGNWQDTENYCLQSIAAISGLINKAQLIKDQWDTLEIQCANYNNWFVHCDNNSAFCYMTENELESAYWNWADLPASLLNDKRALEDLLVLATQQVYTDIDQGTLLADLQQQIAETNNLISLTAYQNEVREIKALTKKTQNIFVPIVIILLLIFLGIYLYKSL